MPRREMMQLVRSQLQAEPKFPCQIKLPEKAPVGDWLGNEWSRGLFSRSSRRYWVSPKNQSHAYAAADAAGKVLTWSWGGRSYQDFFIAVQRPEPEDLPLGLTETARGSEAGTQTSILKSLQPGPLFSDELLTRVRAERPTATWKSVKNALFKLNRKGLVVKWDEPRGGHRFGPQYLWGLPGCNFQQRIPHLDPRIISPQQRRFLAEVRGAIWLLRDLKTNLGMSDDWASFWVRKLGQQAPLRVEALGSGYEYHIEVHEDPNMPPEGKGLVPWLRWVNLFGSLVVYDSERTDPQQLRDFIRRVGYWLSEEGKRRNLTGQLWEDYTAQFFDICDRRREWQLRVLEHLKKHRTREGREIDHWYRCQLGPPELGITLNLIFECKSGFVTVADLAQLLSACLSEPELVDRAEGGLKKNVLPVMVGGKTAESTAFQWAAKRGIRICLHTSLEDVVARLTGRPRETFHQIVTREARSSAVVEPGAVNPHSRKEPAEA